jgi:hypothetical protein
MKIRKLFQSGKITLNFIQVANHFVPSKWLFYTVDPPFRGPRGRGEDVNRTTQKPYRELKDSEGRPDEEVPGLLIQFPSE